jgi:SpoVK/Ycf46/Vps4 family AAA+-type ATPase
VLGPRFTPASDFYGIIHRVFHEAKENAPSVIFIDDSDVIFESGQEHGLYFYLLTMLDGLESKGHRACA